MNAVIAGTHVRWRHINEETGQPAVDCDGQVVAVDMVGKSFVFLILRSDGLFVTADATDVEVLADEYPEPSEVGLNAAIPDVVALPDGGAGALVRLAVGIRALGLADDTTDVDPIAQALKLLGEALGDLREMQEQLDAAGGGDERLNQLLAERKALTETVKKLSDEVAELRTKKAKKPKAADKAVEKTGDVDKGSEG